MPYLAGFKAHIQSHVAPAPFGDPRLYGSWPREHILDAELETLTQTALVLSHPPLEATTVPSDSDLSSETAVLTITSHISVGCEGGAQIVVCNVVKDDKPPFEALAKIFDPLYYRFNHIIASQARDVTAEADQDYATEAAAYKQIKSAGRASKATPAYYGSWTFNQPILSGSVQQMRPVRLVLIEHLQGSNLHRLRIRNTADFGDGKDAVQFSEEHRLEVLAQAMNSYVRVLHCGVEQNDFAARNVILCSPDTSKSMTVTGASIPRVAIIDYNTAIVHKCTLDGESIEENLALPVNPVQWFWKQSLGGDFLGWVPPEWEGSRKPMQEWLLQKFGSEEQRTLYEPVTEVLEIDDW